MRWHSSDTPDQVNFLCSESCLDAYVLSRKLQSLLPNFLLTDVKCELNQERFQFKVRNVPGTLRVFWKCTYSAPFYQIYLRHDLGRTWEGLGKAMHFTSASRSRSKVVENVCFILQAFMCVLQKFKFKHSPTYIVSSFFFFL